VGPGREDLARGVARGSTWRDPFIDRALLSPPRSQVASRGKYGTLGLNAMFANIARSFGEHTQPYIREFEGWCKQVVAFEKKYACPFTVA